MGNFFEILILSSFIFFSLYFPGRIILEKINIENDEKFVLSFGVSCFLFYIFGFSGYVINLNSTIFNGLFLLISLILSLILTYKNKIQFENKLLIQFFISFLFVIFYQSFIPFYSGGLWFFDWFEHYFRSAFFLYRLPLNIKFEGYIIPSRPPFFNIVSFFYLSIIGADFYKYQIISSILNLLLILSVYLFCKNYLKIENKNLFAFVCFILILNPYILRQITYTWTKPLCVYYVICGLYFYLNFLKNNEKIYLIFSSWFSGIGFIVHFSAGPYILGILIHFLFRAFFERNLFKKFLIFVSIFFATIFTYFSWSIKNYGIKNSFLSNTTYQQQKNIDFLIRIEKDINNFYKTIFPVIPEEYRKGFSFYNDRKFETFNFILPLYSSNIWGNLTFTLSIFLLFIIFKKFENFLNVDKSFFKFYLPFTFIISLIVNPTKDLCGVAHVTFLPFVCILLSFVIKEVLNFRGFKILLLIYFLECMSIFIFQIYIYRNYFTLSKTIYFYKTTGIEKSHFSNFLLKTNNQLVFLYDKFFSFK
jgi:hypothetical protein